MNLINDPSEPLSKSSHSYLKNLIPEIPLLIAGSKSGKLEYIVSEDQLDDIGYVLRKSVQEKSASLINFCTKKDINIDSFYTFLIASLFDEGGFMGEVNEALDKLVLPVGYDQGGSLQEKYPGPKSRYPDLIIEKSKHSTDKKSDLLVNNLSHFINLRSYLLSICWLFYF